MSTKEIRVAVIDNSIDSSVYKPVEHWSDCLPVPWESFRAVSGRLPDLSDGYTHLIITGSEASIVERDAWVYREVEVVQEALEKGLPILGSCYGHQLLALATRGPSCVQRCPHPEVGWIPLRIVKRNGLLGEPGTTYAFSSHFDEVVNLDEDFEVLASTSHCPIQAFHLKARPVWGIQFHPEINVRAATEYLKSLINRGSLHSAVFEKALKMPPQDSGLIRRIVRHFLSSTAKAWEKYF